MCPSNTQQAELPSSMAERFESGSVQFPTSAPQPERPVPGSFEPHHGAVAWVGKELTEAEHWGMVRARPLVQRMQRLSAGCFSPFSMGEELHLAPYGTALPARSRERGHTLHTVSRPPCSLCPVLPPGWRA
jgi:hypothetical protein